MKTKTEIFKHLKLASVAACAAFLLAGCQTAEKSSSTATVAPSAPATTTQTASATPAPAAAAPAVAAPASGPVTLPIRIKAGSTEGFTDKNGNRWLPDQGFTDGDTVDRADTTVANASDSKIYQAERYSMTKFEQALPNGHYTVKLHFCETYDGITGAGQRVFTFKVQDKEFKDFDVWAKAGGFQKAYIETVPVDVTNGKLTITFTPNVENPQINGIEILQ